MYMVQSLIPVYGDCRPERAVLFIMHGGNSANDTVFNGLGTY